MRARARERGNLLLKSNLLGCHKLGHHRRHRVSLAVPLNAPLIRGCAAGTFAASVHCATFYAFFISFVTVILFAIFCCCEILLWFHLKCRFAFVRFFPCDFQFLEAKLCTVYTARVEFLLFLVWFPSLWARLDGNELAVLLNFPFSFNTYLNCVYPMCSFTVYVFLCNFVSPFSFFVFHSLHFGRERISLMFNALFSYCELNCIKHYYSHICESLPQASGLPL